MSSSATATGKVFGIYELLELIICQLPARPTRELKLVARQWRDLIKQLTAIKRARVLYPALSNAEVWTVDELKNFAKEDVDLTRELTEDKLASCRSMSYCASSWIRVNPLLGTMADESGIHILLPLSLSDVDAEKQEDFVTDPPICALGLHTDEWDDRAWQYVVREYNQAWVYNKDGVKIKDIIAVQREMQRVHRTVVDPAVETPLVVNAHFRLHES